MIPCYSPADKSHKLDCYIIWIMIGPHYERLAEMEQKMTGKQLLEKIKNRPDNPLTRIVDKLKR